METQTKVYYVVRMPVRDEYRRYFAGLSMFESGYLEYDKAYATRFDSFHEALKIAKQCGGGIEKLTIVTTTEEIPVYDNL